MMAPEYYTFTGGVVPDHVTHVLIDKALKFVPRRAFFMHPNIQELICHDGVEMIGREAFCFCPSLRRVLMPGVKEIKKGAFVSCRALSYIECGKLERIGGAAFLDCTSLSSVDLPSVRIVEGGAFTACENLINAKFGKELESVRSQTFYNCPSLERITLPLKDGVMTYDDTFQHRTNLHHVDLVGGVKETVAVLLLEEWKKDMNEEIELINQILPNTTAGNWNDPGGKARAIRTWIRSVLSKIIRYKSEHRRCLNVAAATLQPALPNDILFKNVLPFLELPSYTFQGENEEYSTIQPNRE